MDHQWDDLLIWKFQVITFNTEAAPVLPGTQTQWLEVADTPKLEAISAALRERVPAGGTSLYNAFEALRALPTPPDNIFLLTDGLPTQAERPPRGSKVSGNQRLQFFRDAIRRLPSNVPVNIESQSLRAIEINHYQPPR